MIPPMTPKIKIKEKFNSDMAKAASLLTEAWAKRKIMAASLNPRPPIEIGKRVIALAMGVKIKK